MKRFKVKVYDSNQLVDSIKEDDVRDMELRLKRLLLKFK